MHEYLHNKPEIIPQATCSSSSGLVINKEINKENINESIEKTSANDESDSDNTATVNTLPREKTSANDESDSDNTATVNTLPRKRKKENLCEKRHREKMARLDTFNDLFKKMVDKM
ncbi:hypothetical protein QE152_g12743 [Popillia japonica]|uniref:BHLH domain-containing protein n=1 Tax=Popillia japonica TaxID=7064 RepID=A0AAW1LQH9_POPJA